MRSIKGLAGVVIAVALIFSNVASAANFSPTTRFKLSPAKVNKFTKVSVAVSQNRGEEELQFVTLRIPAGFNLPSDAALAGCTLDPSGRTCPGGDTLGTGSINIAGGPGCRPDVDDPDLTMVAENVPATLKERDRTDEEKDQGIKAVWILEITGVTTIPLSIKGSKSRGWRLDGEIVPNDNTCPPLDFNLAIDPRSADGKGLIKTPAKAGKYGFSATYSGTQGSVRTIRQTVKIRR